MGFKEIEKFNDVLLSKHVWCMINNPDSLCYRVFKARFFSEGSILDAKESSIESYAWNSILGARDVIRKGMVWRIGNGQSVRLKEDRWLPKQCNKAIFPHLPSIQTETKVSSLINQDLSIWKSDVVEQLFPPHEASIILSIPLSPRLPPNRIIWGHTPNGCFTANSAYKVLVSCVSTNSAGSYDLAAQKQFWKGLWNLRVPNNIKHFARRACNNALLTKVNLHRRHIIPTDTCEVCSEQPEDQIYALWLCKGVETVWRSFHQAHYSNTPPPSSFADLLANFLQFHEDYRKEIFILCAWCLWNRRNSTRLGLPVQPLATTISTAGRMLQDFLVAQDPAPSAPPHTIQHQWRPPDPQNYKANFDAAVFKATNTAGMKTFLKN